MTDEEFLALAARVLALSPTGKLIVAMALADRDPRLAEAIARHATDELALQRLLPKDRP